MAPYTWAEAFIHMDDISHLDENWDGEGSPGTDADVWRAANMLLMRIFFSLYPKGSPPWICPIPGGTLQFEWTVGAKHVEIEFIGTKHILLLTEYKTAENPIMSCYEIPLKKHRKIMKYIKWLKKPDRPTWAKPLKEE